MHEQLEHLHVVTDQPLTLTMLETLPPTQAELLALYPAKFTWIQVKTFINDGYYILYIPSMFDLMTLRYSGRLLKRHPALDKRYGLWCAEICNKYGSIGESVYPQHEISPDIYSRFISVNYLLEYRLHWGKPDALSLVRPAPKNEPVSNRHPDSEAAFQKPRPDMQPYFTVDTPEDLISITRNDWPYSG